MTEVHRYKVVKMLSEGGNRISYDPHGPEVVMAEAYDQLKAENEALRGAMHRVMEQVDGNIRETVRDCVNGRDDVQDIYGYCDAIELIISAALAKEASHG